MQLAVGPDVVAQALVKARWSDDEGLTTRINPEVAHYTGQTELADAIQEGLAAKAAGDDATATTRLGRAVQLAEATGNAEATTRLRKVVDIDDPETGTVRLRRDVAEGRRDGARHRLHQDDEDPLVTRCPNGHYTSAADYCDICGAPLDAAARSQVGAAGLRRRPSVAPAARRSSPARAAAPRTRADALFCESCGYDFTTGTMPRPLDPPAGTARRRPAGVAAGRPRP